MLQSMVLTLNNIPSSEHRPVSCNPYTLPLGLSGLSSPSPQSQRQQTFDINHPIQGFISSKGFYPSVQTVKSPRCSSRLPTQHMIPKIQQTIKPKRVTLPPSQLSHSLFCSNLTSPERRPSTLIRFTYVKPKRCATEPCQDQNQQLFSSTFQAQKGSPKIVQKRQNKICSGQINLKVNPLVVSKESKEGSVKVCDESKEEKPFLKFTRRRESLKARESKMTSAETTISAMQGLKDSSNSSSSKWGGSFQSKHIFETFSAPKTSLADSLPSSKKLNKTIFFTQTAYDFGGLIQTNNKIQFKRPEEQSVIERSRQWSRFRGLMEQQAEQDLKESIHCGPDIRSSRFSCEMLKGFGREIKESIVSFQD